MYFSTNLLSSTNTSNLPTATDLLSDKDVVYIRNPDIESLYKSSKNEVDTRLWVFREGRGQRAFLLEICYSPPVNGAVHK